jgi:hypothetical protein
MRGKTGLVVCALGAALVLQEAKAQTPPEQAARDIVRRVLPVNAFLVEILP